MSPDQINIAIAEYCGLPINICRCGDGPDASIHSVSCEYAHMFSPMADTPDYHHDLNAMHEVWAAVVKDNDSLRGRFGDILGKVVSRDMGRDFCLYGYIEGATAAQRAETFLRTVGKWEDGE